MTYSVRFSVALFGVAAIAAVGATNEPNAQPNPYNTVENYFKMPEGRTWGAAAGVSLDSHNHIWVAERCGVNSCAGFEPGADFGIRSIGKTAEEFRRWHVCISAWAVCR